MVRLGTCPGCSVGNHKRHDRNYAPAPPGVMGGAMCPCEGECQDVPPDERMARLLGITPRRLAQLRDAMRRARRR